ncbi:putative xyloglucan endotransglucosylase/hydrolase protein 1, partial [Impatiens glandulifera]|uniref:putative xyloglucan endotransglucosylase/hydrolase protein 1 n=1 Tax=Impatiens glandulifera TaxID=253017 RepID=UPI001FB0DAA7
LISKQEFGNHDELDFEFIGTKGLIQTNIFTNDGGNREKRIQLGFDPSKDFHTYEIDLSSRRVVFRIDNKPIRVFLHSSRRNYISKPLHVEASIWNGTWAGVVDWKKGPFKAYYQGFYIQGTICNS